VQWRGFSTQGHANGTDVALSLGSSPHESPAVSLLQPHVQPHDVVAVGEKSSRLVKSDEPLPHPSQEYA
jgi:hypothetical protein